MLSRSAHFIFCHASILSTPAILGTFQSFQHTILSHLLVLSVLSPLPAALNILSLQLSLRLISQVPAMSLLQEKLCSGPLPSPHFLQHLTRSTLIFAILYYHLLFVFCANTLYKAHKDFIPSTKHQTSCIIHTQQVFIK